MFKKHFTRLMIVVVVILIQTTIKAQEFPIAEGSDNNFSGGGAYDGQNFLVAILGDSLSPDNITAQLVAPSGNLIGARIALGDTGVFPGASSIFDGTNYLLNWFDFDGNLKGQLIDTSGNLVGSSINIASGLSTARAGLSNLAFSDSTYLAIFVKTNNVLYGQRISKAGNLIGSQILISSNFAREISLAYDGANYLVDWVEDVPNQSDKDIYGQFVSKDGVLVGSNFVIDNGPYYSDNPTSLAFDGTRYLLAYHETPNSQSNFVVWTLMGRFITTSGTIQETITICDSTEYPNIPFVAYDGNNYFITWTQFSNESLMGRFFDTSGVPIDTPFVLFDPLDDKIPMGGAGFGGDQYLVVATRVDSDFTDGDVYGRFIQPVTGVEGEIISGKSMLSQNFPNPFNPETTIEFSIQQKSYIGLSVYNIKGQKIKTLAHNEFDIGSHSIIWNGDDESGNSISSGLYLYKLIVNGKTKSVKKCLLLK